MSDTLTEFYTREQLLFHLEIHARVHYKTPNRIKGLSLDYILDCVFNEKIQAVWTPQVGDMIIGPTGNVFFISGSHELVPQLGGIRFFFGGGMCNRDGGRILNSTYCFTMNESGNMYGYDNNGKIEVKKNSYHSSYREFRFVPYPHEIDRLGTT